MLANLFDGKLMQVVGVKDSRLYFFGWAGWILVSRELLFSQGKNTNKHDFVIHYKTELH